VESRTQITIRRTGYINDAAVRLLSPRILPARIHLTGNMHGDTQRKIVWRGCDIEPDYPVEVARVGSENATDHRSSG
jgi:hypothetical protein